MPLMKKCKFSNNIDLCKIPIETRKCNCTIVKRFNNTNNY